MKDGTRTESRTSRWLKGLLKLAITAVCLWYVSGKIDFDMAGMALQDAEYLYLFVAFLLFLISKLISAFRLNIYFSNIQLYLSAWQNTRLYWLGMFYNLFLPGSISGDAYKVILLSKKYKKPYKKTGAAVVLDRFSGLAGLGLILAVFGIFVLKNLAWIMLLMGGAISAVILLWVFVKNKLKDFMPGFASTLILGILVQATQVVSIYMIMRALHIENNHASYIFVFLISSVVSVLPITIGGLGIREVVFLEGAAFFGLMKEGSVMVSLIFYLLTLISSAFGIWYVFKNPLEKEKDPLLSPSS